MNTANKIKHIVIAYWLSLLGLNLATYYPRLGLFDSFYFFVTTVTTVGYGGLKPEDIPEKIVSMITSISATVSYAALIGVVAGAFIIFIKRRMKFMYKPKGIIKIMIISSNATKLKIMLEELKELDVVVVCDGTESQYNEIVRLKNIYKFNAFHQESIYDDDFLSPITEIETLCICSADNSSVQDNINKVLGMVNFFESRYNCRSIAEVKGSPKELQKFSQGDIMVPVTDGTLLALEIKKEGAFFENELLIKRMRERE